MKHLLTIYFVFSIFQFGARGAPPVVSQSNPNVLFIAIDDLRPTLGCYGDEVVISTNFDRLAESGTRFDRAYCQLAVCCPSRLSLLSGMRPDTIEVWDLGTHFRDARPDLVSLPQHFKNNGYYTRSIGKILHGGGRPAKDPPSWSEDAIHDVISGDRRVRYALPQNLIGTKLKQAASEAADVLDGTFIDGIVCEAALGALDSLSANEQPFFLAVGFRKPHLPFVAPKKYWDLYDRDTIPSPASNRYPDGAPEYGTRSWHELEGYTDIPENTASMSTEQIQNLRHGYYACISYVDSLLGRLLDRLETLEIADNTVICLWGDHGFHLGEQGLWTKANNYELSARVPLMLSVPGQSNKGAVSNAFVELVDLYPTLAEVCGLDIPIGLEGVSMKALLESPNQPWKTAVFNQYPRMYKDARHSRHGEVMGYATRTDRYRYVEWRDWNSGEVLAQELYDHTTDPDEMKNVAGNPEYARALSQHQKILSAGWRGALPPK